MVDDHDQLRGLLVTVLGRHARFEVVGEAATAADARRLAGELRPDVVLLDASLPDGSGVDAVGSIRAASPATDVVIFSGAPPARPEDVGEARGWLTKGASVRDTIAELLAVLDADPGDAP